MQTLCFINCQLQLILKQWFDQEIYFFGKKTQSTKIPITDIIRILWKTQTVQGIVYRGKTHAQ